jgi:hypothetical protein
MPAQEATDFLQSWVPNERLQLHMKQVAAVMRAWAIEKVGAGEAEAQSGGWPDCCTMPTGKNTPTITAASLSKNWSAVTLTRPLFNALLRTDRGTLAWNRNQRWTR